MRVASEASSNVFTERRSFPTPTPTDLARIRSHSTPCGSKPAICGGRPLNQTRRFHSTCGKAIWSPLPADIRRGEAIGREPSPRTQTMTYDPEQEPYVALRTKALESLLIEKGLLSAAAVDERISQYERDIGPLKGARVVARAWVDPDFKSRLLQDGSAIAELGLPGGGNLVVVENTPSEHHMVVCTLCSCYPWMVLGLPPTWYKSFAYRSRAVIEPRAVLREFGLDLNEDVTVHVHDSSAEVRYMVLPERPAGTEDLTEEQLAALVTRDAMIGVSKVNAPAPQLQGVVPG